MKRIHMPRVDARYWAAITLASIFGTNLGDFYAHASGLGIVPGLLVLLAVAAATALVERFDPRIHEVYYWLVIIIIRTGATNIADYIAFRLRIPAIPFAIGLAVVLALLSLRMSRAARMQGRNAGGLPDTDGAYWAAMLVAGVFGTMVGDICSRDVGQGTAAIGLGLLLALALLGRRSLGRTVATYWLTVAIARTAGTAIGDWLAESRSLAIGLPLSTLLTGAAFVLVLVLWRSRPVADAPLAA